jgi:hypothetical protein
MVRNFFRVGDRVRVVDSHRDADRGEVQELTGGGLPGCIVRMGSSVCAEWFLCGELELEDPVERLSRVFDV